MGYISGMLRDISDLVSTLRINGGDHADVEVKAAQGGLPESLTSTLSALANLPGGGLIILGLDERAGFVPVGLDDPQALKQALGNRARGFLPPVRLSIDDAQIGDQPVIVATVHECDPSAKPCRVQSSGLAYLRSYDGDYALSAIEEQAFLAARKAPHFDREAVSGTTRSDLDSELVAAWLDTVRRDSATALGRFRDDEEVLRRAGVVTSSGELSLAGLLTLGAYPQEHLPRFVVQAAADPLPGDPPDIRARNAATFDGPIPTMLAGIQRWAAKNMSSTIRGGSSGDVRTQYDYPLEAVRELVTNALIHRDLDTWSQGLAVEVRLRQGRFVIANPGGLYGITVDRLGLEHVTSARNQRLVNLCQYARIPGRDARVIEGLATGLPTVARELATADLPPAQFIDEGIRFTVILHRTRHSGQGSRSRSADDGRSVILPAGTNLAAVYRVLTEPRTAAEIAQRTELTKASVRKALQSLRDNYGIVEQHGGRGRHTTYERRPRRVADPG